MYDDDLRFTGYRRKQTWPMRHPLATRVLLLVAGFALLAPVLRLVGGDSGDTVRTQALPGAALGGDRILRGSTTSIDSDTSASSAGTDPAPTDAEGTLPPTVPDGLSSDSSSPSAASRTSAALPMITAGSTAASSSTKVTSTPSATTTTSAKTRATSTTTTTVKAKVVPTTTTTTMVKAKPTTTTKPKPAPTTTTTVLRPTYSQAQVIATIQSVWPVELQDKALKIAWRESNYQPTAKNWCCYGLFQIHAAANAALLRSMGVTPDQLFDPLINSKVAYAMYLRSGWAPWGG